MQHARQPHIIDHFKRAKDLAGQIPARQRLPDDLEVGRLLERCLHLDSEAVAQTAVPLDGLVEVAPPNEFGIGDAFRPVRNRVDDAIGDGEFVHRQPELFACQIDQQAPGLGSRSPEHGAAVGYADGGACAAHVEGQGAVAHDHAHALISDIDFLRHHLCDGSLESLPAVDLAIIGDDGAVALDGDVGG